MREEVQHDVRAQPREHHTEVLLQEPRVGVQIPSALAVRTFDSSEGSLR